MDINKILKLYYIIYTIYIILIAELTTISFMDIFFPIVLIWLLYIFFSLGFGKNIKKNRDIIEKNIWIFKQKNITLLIIGTLSIISSYVSISYYTGQTPFLVIKNLSNNVSVYYVYQNFFRNNIQGFSTLKKLPYIFLLFFVKFLFFYYITAFFKRKKKNNKEQKLFLVIVVVSYLYVGLGRGTNFEFFEFLFLIIFVILSNQKHNKLKINRNIITMFTGILLLILLYNSRISARGSEFNYYISKDVSYYKNNLITYISPIISFILLSIYSYFGFGFFYIGKFILEISIKSVDIFFALLLPKGFLLFQDESILDAMKKTIDIGVKWHPDMIIVIDKIGIVGLFLLCYLLGVLSKRIYKIYPQNCIKELSLFNILLFMFSLPVGNFIFASSSSILITLILCLYSIYILFFKKSKKLINYYDKKYIELTRKK